MDLGPARPSCCPSPRPSRARRSARLAPAAVLALVLTGCGGADPAADESTSAPPTRTTASSSASSSASPGGPLRSTQVAIVSQTAAGGEVLPAATALSDDATVQAFGAQFTTPRLAGKITRVVARTDVPAGSTLYGAVVAVGCDVPSAVVVTADPDGGVLVEAAPAKPSGVQCLAPVTSVALVVVTGARAGSS